MLASAWLPHQWEFPALPRSAHRRILMALVALSLCWGAPEHSEMREEVALGVWCFGLTNPPQVLSRMPDRKQIGGYGRKLLRSAGEESSSRALIDAGCTAGLQDSLSMEELVSSMEREAAPPSYVSSIGAGVYDLGESLGNGAPEILGGVQSLSGDGVDAADVADVKRQHDVTEERLNKARERRDDLKTQLSTADDEVKRQQHKK